MPFLLAKHDLRMPTGRMGKATCKRSAPSEVLAAAVSLSAVCCASLSCSSLRLRSAFVLPALSDRRSSETSFMFSCRKEGMKLSYSATTWRRQPPTSGVGMHPWAQLGTRRVRQEHLTSA